MCIQTKYIYCVNQYHFSCRAQFVLLLIALLMETHSVIFQPQVLNALAAIHNENGHPFFSMWDSEWMWDWVKAVWFEFSWTPAVKISLAFNEFSNYCRAGQC